MPCGVCAGGGAGLVFGGSAPVGRQSTISEAIANLEISLGVMLFDRQARLLTLRQ